MVFGWRSDYSAATISILCKQVSTLLKELPMSLIETRIDGHVLLIKLNRPEKLNALTPAMYHELCRAYAQLSSDANLRVAVLYAEGKHFSAGLELDLWTASMANGVGFGPHEGEIDLFGLQSARHTKPVVMAVQGYCFTWGVEALLNTEIRVAASDTQFAMLEVQRGIYPCGGATLRLPKEIGWGNAQRYLLTGDRWTAQQALGWGLVQELTEPGAQFEKALEIARKIAKAAPLGVQGVLRSTRLAATSGEAAALSVLFADLVPVFRSEDAKEGVASFLERREAKFTGR
jgi:enoyl-CoA hydratase/carnithine racemase